MSDAAAALSVDVDRQGRLGASEVGALFGLDPFCTRFELWHRKAGNLPPEDLSDNRHVFWGHLLEPAVAQGVALREGWEVRKVEARDPHPEIPRFGATRDYEVLHPERGLGDLEIKTADTYAVRSWENDEPPLRYQLQLQAQLDCSGHEWGAIAVLVGGNHLRVFTYSRHEQAIRRVRREVVAFWRSIDNDKPPAIDWLADLETVRRLYRETAPGKALDLSHDKEFSSLCRGYKCLGRAIKHMEDRRDAIKAQIFCSVQDAAVVTGDGCRVTARDVAEKAITYTRKAYRDVRVTVEEDKEATE